MRPAAAAIALAALLLPRPAAAAELVVRVVGLRNTEGLVRVSLFRSAAGFPERSEKAVHTLSVEAARSPVEVRFTDIEPGTWAVAVLHDEDRDGLLDRGFLGIPDEGIGASNGASRRMGPPLFDDARVLISRAGAVLTIALRYF